MSDGDWVKPSESAVVPFSEDGAEPSGLKAVGGSVAGQVQGVRHLRLVGHGTRYRALPLASVGLYAIGQLILALVIAVGEVGPLVGIVICLIWMLCGLLLIAAQLRSDQRGRQRRSLQNAPR